MNKQIIADIADDADALGEALGARRLAPESIIACVAGAMPGFVAYEVDVIRRAEPVDRLGRGDIGPQDDPRIPGRTEPGER